MGAFAARLVAALATYVSVERVDRGRIERALGRGAADAAVDGADGTAVIAWLQRLEAAADIVVYVADDQATAWTARCLRQADRVLLVGEAARAARRTRPPAPRWERGTCRATVRRWDREGRRSRKR